MSQHLRDLRQFGNAVDAKLPTSIQPSVRQRIFSYFHYFFFFWRHVESTYTFKK